MGVAVLYLLAACSNPADSTASPSSAATPPTSYLPLITNAEPTPNCGEKTNPRETLPDASEVAVDNYTLTNTYPHDASAFTQGLQYVDDVLIEGTGLYGKSRLRYVRLTTGEVLQEISLNRVYFGEGVTVFEDRVYQLTWREQTAFVYDRETLERENAFDYPTEGWGLTHNGRCLIMSDGSSTLYFRDPDTFAELGQLPVYDDTGPIRQINELEYIEGEIYANIWMQNRIARISPETGQVLGWLALDDLVDRINPVNHDDVLNGIAFNEENGRLFVTGKRWPLLFEIERLP